jgi:hypothetical protein
MTERVHAFMPARVRLTCKALRVRFRRFTPERLVSPQEYAVEGAQRLSIDARLSLTVSFLYGKKKNYAVHFRGKRGSRISGDKKFENNPNVEKSSRIACVRNEMR